jgi:hypothetical protein
VEELAERTLTFDEVMERLRGWAGEEVFVIVREREASRPLAYVNGVLHLHEDMCDPEQYAFHVGPSRDSEIDLFRSIFHGAEGDDSRIWIRSGSGLIGIGTDIP